MSKQQTTPGYVFIAIGQNVWGRADTMLEAMQNAANQSTCANEFVLNYCHPNTKVDPVWGGLVHPMANPPVRIGRFRRVAKRFYAIELD